MTLWCPAAGQRRQYWNMDDTCLQTSEESAVSVGLNRGINRGGEEPALLICKLSFVLISSNVKRSGVF